MPENDINCVTNSDQHLMEMFRPFALKMESQAIPPIAINLFKCYYAQLLYGSQGKLSDKEILPLAPNDLPRLEELSAYEEKGRENMSKLAIIKLNGGLGTTMGLEKAKSLIPVKEGRNFLDLILEQTRILRRKHTSPLPLLFMNSFRTHLDTMLAVSEFENPDDIPLAFVQHKYPKIRSEDLKPASWPDNPDLEWNPPGHGDIYLALITSGLLTKLLNRGYEYAFISNADNLGALMDQRILGYVADKGLTFMMEVTKRSPSDSKGGHLCRLLKNNRLALREIAQCPNNQLESFMDIEKYSYFNTNSVWLNLKALEQVFLEHKMIPLDLLINSKTLDPRNENTPKVFQLETAMGSAISSFKHAEALEVPRTRFAPIKTTADLLLVRSDHMRLTEKGSVEPASGCREIPPQITLDPRYYKKIDAFEQRFPHGAPSLCQCGSLEVKGDVLFGKEVKIKDRVKIINTADTQGKIKDGTEIAFDMEI
ncbi:MAG: UTP--glucose-1-phosphate uridylyltransferase [Desulfonatronovibrionaceae bacterium]